MEFVVIKAQTPEQLARKLSELSIGRQIGPMSLAMWHPHGAVAIVGIGEDNGNEKPPEAGGADEEADESD